MKSARASEPHPGAEYGTFGADYRFVSVEDTVHPVLRRVLDCWIALRGDRPMPRREEFSPFNVRTSLRNILLFDLIDGGQDFRFRLMGSAVAELTGLQVTGKVLSELEPERVRARIIPALRRTVETAAPVRQIANVCSVAHLSHRRTEAVYLPLAGDDGGVAQILTGVVFIPHATAGGAARGMDA